MSEMNEKVCLLFIVDMRFGLTSAIPYTTTSGICQMGVISQVFHESKWFSIVYKPNHVVERRGYVLFLW